MPLTKSKSIHLNTHLVGILRTKPGTPLSNTLEAIQGAFSSGMEAVEITSNSEHWYQVVDYFTKKNFNIGVGSIKDKITALEAVDCGAKFFVSPGTFVETIEVAQKYNVPILPGVYTEEDLNTVIKLGISDIKFFPANVSTHEELFKAIKEPFRDEFEELTKLGWEIVPCSSLTPYPLSLSLVQSPSQFYKLYLEAKNKRPDSKIIIQSPDEKVGFDRLKYFATEASKHEIRTYAVGGVNDKNMKEVLTKYGAYGVCPGSGMFNSDAIFNGDYERVKADVKRHVEVIKEIFSAQSC